MLPPNKKVKRYLQLVGEGGSFLRMQPEVRQEILNEDEAADYLELSPETLRTWRSKDKGPQYLMLEGRTIRYTLSDLNDYLSRQPRGGPSGE